MPYNRYFYYEDIVNFKNSYCHKGSFYVYYILMYNVYFIEATNNIWRKQAYEHKRTGKDCC